MYDIYFLTFLKLFFYASLFIYFFTFRPSGIVFAVDKVDFNLNVALNKGDVVTIEYEGRSRNEVPTNPKFSRVRTDISWDDVCSEYNNAGPSTGTLIFSIIFITHSY
jgi:hypothetical protein